MKLSGNKLHLIDMKYHKSGHYLDDLKEFYSFSDSYCCNYYAPVGDSLELNGEFKVHSKLEGWRFYFLIFRMLLLNRKDKFLFLSCSFFPLFFLSVASFNFNYVFRIHSFPVVRVGFYKIIIPLISRLSRQTIFLDFPVMQFFIDNNLTDKDKSICVIGRVIPDCADSKEEAKSDESTPFKLLFIGAMNEEKDLHPVISGLSKRKIEGISLSFLSKGINLYNKELSELLDIYPGTHIYDGFLPREDFDQAIRDADALILPYRKSYGVRFSAVLNDALRQKKKVLTIRLPQFEYYSEKYNACALYDDETNVSNAVFELLNREPLKACDLLADYSEVVKKDQFMRINL